MHGNKSTPVAEKSGSSSVFGSTWGASDSFWGSYFTSPGSSSDQGGGGGKGKSDSGEGVKEAPKPSSMARGAGARRLKSQTSSSNRTQSSEQRKKVTSPRLTSPPKSSSTPLPQPKEKEKGSTSESTGVESSSRTESGTGSSPKPEQVVATPKNSSKSQSISKTLMKASEGEKGEASSPEGGEEIKAKKPGDQNWKSRATPDRSEPVKDSNNAATAILEATDSGGSTAAKNNAVTVVEKTAVMKEETNKQLDTSSLNLPVSTKDSKTRDAELTRKSSSPESQSLPTATTGTAHSTAHGTVEEKGTGHQVPSQTENSSGHSAIHHDAQQDSTDTQQTRVKQTPLADQKLETKPERDSNSESKPREQDKVITNEQSHTGNKEFITKATETKDSTVQHEQLQTPSGDDGQMSEPERGRSPSSVVVQDKGKGEGGQQPVDGGKKDKSTPPEGSAAANESSDIDRLKKVRAACHLCIAHTM